MGGTVHFVRSHPKALLAVVIVVLLACVSVVRYDAKRNVSSDALTDVGVLGHVIDVVPSCTTDRFPPERASCSRMWYLESSSTSAEVTRFLRNGGFEVTGVLGSDDNPLRGHSTTHPSRRVAAQAPMGGRLMITVREPYELDDVR